ncbi:MAG: hypothetical protein VW437_06325 [Betaproteobacteria bacterium]|jgi:hypothetical protein
MLRNLLLILVFLAGTPAFASDIDATVSIPYKTFNSEVRAQAIERAKETAWKKYTSRFNQAQKSNYKAHQNEFKRNLNELIVDYQVIQEKNDTGAKIFKLAIRVSIDDTGVNALFADLSTAGNQGLGQASDFGSVLIARVTVQSQEFKARPVDISSSQAEQSINESSGTDGVNSLESTGTKTVTRKESGGSVTRKRAENSFDIDEGVQEELNSIMGEALVNAGFEPLEYFELTDFGAPEMEDVYLEMTDNATLKGSTIKAIRDAAVEAGWSFLAIGNVDIDAPLQDPATGLVKIAAQVSAKVYMLTDGRARTVASVRATQVYGLDETQQAAQTNALNAAASKAMETVVAQLQKKGIR